ncbi:MAG: tyrosine-type recombinase/integrase [Acidimicrobiia bacterium]
MARRRQYGTIRRLPSGRWQARRNEDGRQVAAPTTFATKAEANAWLSATETDIARGRWIDPARGEVAFGTYARDWMDHKADIRSRTKETYESQLKPILDRFERVPLGKIDAVAVRRWHADLLRSGRHPNTVAKIYRLFRSILGTAVDDGVIAANPCHIRRAAREVMIERPALTSDDVRRLAAAIEPRFAALVWTAALSGLRFGELTGLARRHVDLDRRVIDVERALGFVKGEGSQFGPPKSVAAYRRVTIPGSCVDVLRVHLETFTGPEPDALVFTSLKGSPLLNRYFAPSWAEAKAAAGVKEDVRFHDLRHFAGTMAATAGASLKEIKARMGQASNDAAIRYLKAAESRDQEIADAIEARLRREASPHEPRSGEGV